MFSMRNRCPVESVFFSSLKDHTIGYVRLLNIFIGFFDLSILFAPHGSTNAQNTIDQEKGVRVMPPCSCIQSPNKFMLTRQEPVCPSATADLNTIDTIERRRPIDTR